MNMWLERFPYVLWPNILSHIEGLYLHKGIDSEATIASIHKILYKWINRDFKAMCYQEGIYRLKGESWATAFSSIKDRAFDLRGRHGLSCPHTGKVVFKLGAHHTIISHMDFSKFEYELIDFTQHFEDEISDIHIINHGKRLIIYCGKNAHDGTSYLYEISTVKVIKKFEATDFCLGVYIQSKPDNMVYDPVNDREFSLPFGMEFRMCVNNDKHSEHRYIPILARSERALYIKDMKTEQIFKMCNVTASDFNHCFFEEAGLLYVRNNVNDASGNKTIRFYEIETRKKVYERTYDEDKDNWDYFSNYAIFNSKTGEYVIFNPKNKQFYSRFICCQHPESYKQLPQDVMCRFISYLRHNGRNCVEWCIMHKKQRTFFFDYSRDKLTLTEIDPNDNPSLSKLVIQCTKFLEERQKLSLDSTTISDEVKQFFESQLLMMTMD
ncbi:unnamed protein product [Bursaphelenchus okinawaensis]|uniref:Uncharacterized protein n=1 Tax=Bursaphelenchus okinawaensis TaxID=465554 RepID=A0A811KQZ8_9BILA|nr:unnamed protein product [Bursaphelenchus okinawaensis]CAG9108354.1 unnamed protein product [Bursaphelenchus okinawaensis]